MRAVSIVRLGSPVSGIAVIFTGALRLPPRCSSYLMASSTNSSVTRCARVDPVDLICRLKPFQAPIRVITLSI